MPQACPPLFLLSPSSLPSARMLIQPPAAANHQTRTIAWPQFSQSQPRPRRLGNHTCVPKQDHPLGGMGHTADLAGSWSRDSQ